MLILDLEKDETNMPYVFVLPNFGGVAGPAPPSVMLLFDLPVSVVLVFARWEWS
jgi:hypothetical protein